MLEWLGGTSKAKFGDQEVALEYIRRDGKLPEDMVNTVNYPAAGYGIFMQGSRTNPCRNSCA